MKVCSLSLEQNQSVVYNCDHASDVLYYCDNRIKGKYLHMTSKLKANYQHLRIAMHEIQQTTVTQQVTIDL